MIVTHMSHGGHICHSHRSCDHNTKKIIEDSRIDYII